jgi:hypothetical protein
MSQLIKQLMTIPFYISFDIIQLMTFHKVDTVIYQPRGSDVHRSQRQISVHRNEKSSIVLLIDTF